MDVSLITNINTVIVLLFCAMSAYQYIYILVSILFSARRFKTAKDHRFAVLICARNESLVIAHLIDSLKRQTYRADLLDIYVMADNCTDNTAEVAAAAGARVYERQNKKLVGKGYALEYLLSCIAADYGDAYYDGYFVFDADNLISPDYVEKMNTVFSNGYRVVTSYRNSKNFSDNWVSSGYGLMFLREARHMNNARMILHSSCVISGTGFLVSSEVVRENNGWPFHCLTEDLEFSMVMISRGEKIGYCHDAIFYDEQPTSFIQSWHQRIRWSKGFLQAFLRHGWKLIRGVFTKKSGFSCFDEVMSTLPTLILSIFGGVSLATMIYLLFADPTYGFGQFFVALGAYLGSIYFVNFLLGLVTVITEWKKIKASPFKKILYTFTFPIFMISNVPITIAACFSRSGWREIKHKRAKSIEELGIMPPADADKKTDGERTHTH